LTSTLREQPIAWSYEQEYPIVLHHSQPPLSHLVVGHGSLWFREFINPIQTKSSRVGLIGNIATTPTHRGQGIQRMLMQHLEETARSQGAKAVILWSDLHSFYQKLGFASISREIRYRFQQTPDKAVRPVRKVAATELADYDLVTMLAMRPKVSWTLQRSAAEFRQLLTIPETHLFMRRDKTDITGWWIIGKGADMGGVIHEWGALGPEILLEGIRSTLRSYEIYELMLLVPGTIETRWHTCFDAACASKETHPMALAKALVDSAEESRETLDMLSTSFIWGLDSI